MSAPVWFSEQEVTRLLQPAALIARLEAAFKDADAGLLTEPRPLRIDAHEHGANYVAFPAYWPAAGIAATKVLSGVLGNPAKGLPKIDAVIVVMDASTGRIRAIMDGRRITALRTAATTALACRTLGIKPNGVLGLIGTGVQMRAHAETMACVAEWETILIASANEDMERACGASAAISALLGRPVQAVSRSELLRRSDTIVLTSMSDVPLVRSEDVKPDAIVASVGPFHPGSTEIDPALVRMATAVMSDMPKRLQDQWSAASAELGGHFDRLVDMQAAIADGGSPAHQGIRVFLSDGRPIEDLAAASLVLEAAEANGVKGMELG
ncbi:ornithine cyclodeaminase [Xaviernesmea oryzae]|uniref:Ornithine cyclodeaminase n=1 Tax=Xaviernesmea oryzae TaxID=464029 RepID=A0A1X7EJ04_9HYPH|nr:ornithine cyclodeaminase family protein [Xaviernesmea oryzae]SMF34654.1 ornithine cyclodeaminase [Xaviernesmea oryzae]